MKIATIAENTTFFNTSCRNLYIHMKSKRCQIEAKKPNGANVISDFYSLLHQLNILFLFFFSKEISFND